MAAASPPSARLPSAAVAIVLIGVTVTMLRSCLRAGGGRLVYPLDDTYIHMAMARNLAQHGSWGLTPGAFEPASSSPLWTLLLAAAVRGFGALDALPLALDVLCMAVVALVLGRLLRGFIVHPLARGAVLLVMLPAIGLPGLAITGMEPVLHMLLVLLLAWTTVRRIGANGLAGGGGGFAIATLAALSVLTRFESLFLIASLTVASLVRRRPLTAVALLAGAAAALAGYMAIALPRGGFWLPNPVMLNAPLPDARLLDTLAPLLRRIPDALRHDRREHIAVLLLAAGWLLLPRRGIVSPQAGTARLLLAVMVATLLLHMQLARFDDFFRRYEAYVVALGVFAVVAALACGLGRLPDGLAARLPRVPGRAIAALVAVLFAIPFVIRGLQLVRWTPRATQNILEQQIQMSRLVRERFRDRVVAINDLGAVGYYGEARIVDLCGLATMPIARAILERRYDTAFIERFCAAERVELAMLYEPWFVGSLSPPPAWKRVARWTLRDNVIAGDPTVTLFATDSATARRVREAERGFARSLPRHVAVEELP